MFTSFLFDPTFVVVDRDRPAVHALGSWDTAVTVTTADDIGTLTAAIVLADEPIANAVVYTAGDTVTYAELADVVERVLGRPVHRAVWDVPRLTTELAEQPDDAMRKYRLVFAQGTGVSWPAGQTFNARRHLPVTTAEQWARSNLRH